MATKGYGDGRGRVVAEIQRKYFEETRETGWKISIATQSVIVAGDFCQGEGKNGWWVRLQGIKGMSSKRGICGCDKSCPGGANLKRIVRINEAPTLRD